MLTFADLVFIKGRTIQHRVDGIGANASFRVLESGHGYLYDVIFTLDRDDTLTHYMHQTREEVEFMILSFQNPLRIWMFSYFLREVIFAMRRLEAIDKPPCPITIGTLIGRWCTVKDDGWDLYNNFLSWYWEVGSTPHTWATKKGSPQLVSAG